MPSGSKTNLGNASRTSTANVRLPLRLIVCFLATLTLSLLILFVDAPAPQNNAPWEFFMLVGLLAGAIMIAIPIFSPRVWVAFGGDPRQLRFLLNLHSDLSYCVVFLLSVHIAGLLIIEPLLIEYLKLSAPWSMLAAIVATVALVALLISSIYRANLRLRYRRWRIWHVGLSVVAMSFTAFHIIDAGYYFNNEYKKVVFVVLAAGPSLVAFGVARWHRSAIAQVELDSYGAVPSLVVHQLRSQGIRLVVWLVLLWLCAAAIITIPKAGSRAEQQRQCEISLCE